MSEAPSQTLRGRIIAVLIGVLVVAVLALAAEGAVRLRSLLKHGHATLRIESLYKEDPATGLRVPVAGTWTDKIKINSQGFRGPEIERVKQTDTTRIAFLGGSTTFCAEVSGNGATWPDLVTNSLKREYPDHHFDYINGGVPGYTAQHSLRNLEGRVAAFAPDIIVIYHSSNDLSWRSRYAAKRQGIALKTGDDQVSWPGQYSLFWYLVEKNLRILARQSSAEDPSGKLVVDAEALSEPFREDLSTLVRAAKRHANHVVLVTFSIRLRGNQTVNEQKNAAVTSLYYMPYMSLYGLITAFEAYNKVIVEVSQAERVALISGENVIPGDSTHFVDSAHFTDEGSRVMAERVYNGLIAAGIFDALPSGTAGHR